MNGFLVHVNPNGEIGNREEPSVMMEAKSVSLFGKMRSQSTVNGIG